MNTLIFTAHTPALSLRHDVGNELVAIGLCAIDGMRNGYMASDGWRL